MTFSKDAAVENHHHLTFDEQTQGAKPKDKVNFWNRCRENWEAKMWGKGIVGFLTVKRRGNKVFVGTGRWQGSLWWNWKERCPDDQWGFLSHITKCLISDDSCCSAKCGYKKLSSFLQQLPVSFRNSRNLGLMWETLFFSFLTYLDVVWLIFHE